VQGPQLFEYKKQENDHGTAGIKEILSQVPQTPGTPGNQVNWELPDPGA
jgi:hypothetical protein